MAQKISAAPEGVAFFENRGQFHDQHGYPRPDVLYAAMTGGMLVQVKTTGVSYQLYNTDIHKRSEHLSNPEKGKENDQLSVYRVDLRWLNHEPNVKTAASGAFGGYTNYYTESCPDGALNVKSYNKITLSNLYKGIDLVYYEHNGELKHDYEVAPYADYRQIRIEVKGADISVNEDGSLFLSTPLGKIQEGAPVVFQNGRQLKSKWKIQGHILSFEIENLDPRFPAVIDPVTRQWGTYYGAGTMYGYACAADTAGNSYLTGKAAFNPSLIATSGAHQTTYGGSVSDAFLVKFDPSGTRLWGTFYGGSSADWANSVSTDISGNVFIAGETTSSNGISTPGSYQTSYHGDDAFLVKFDANGVRQWGTYFGGGGYDFGTSCAADPWGFVYLAGHSTSSISPAFTNTNVHQPAFAGSGDAFLVKFAPNGAMQWATYYGGSSQEAGRACATDGLGNVYLGGFTSTFGGTAIATPGAVQTAWAGSTDGFVAKFDSSGVRQWGTYYGEYQGDLINSLSCDPLNNVYAAGFIASSPGATALATPGTHQPLAGGGNDAILVKFSPAGTRLWATYYGGPSTDLGSSCATDHRGNVFLSGETLNTGTQVATPGSHQPVFGGIFGNDAFLVKFDSTGKRQVATFYGGGGDETGNECATDGYGNVYLSGTTTTDSGTAIATPGAHSATMTGTTYGAYLAKFSACDPPLQPAAIMGDTAVCEFTGPRTYSVATVATATNYVWTFPSGWTGTGNSSTIAVTPVSSGIFSVYARACGVSPVQTMSVTLNPQPTVSVIGGTICAGESFTFSGTGASTYTYSGGQVVSPNISTTYSMTGTSTAGCVSGNTAVATVTVRPLPFVTVNSGMICIGRSFMILPQGASTYSYSNGQLVTPNATTSYSVTGFSAYGCPSSNTAVSTVSVSTVHPVVSVNSGSVCAGQIFTIVPSGASTYTVFGAGPMVMPLTTTVYSVAGTSAEGCVSSNTALSTVIVHARPSLSVTAERTVVCKGESATLTGTGAVSYTFIPGGANPQIMVTPVSTTTYTLFGLSAQGCSNTVQFVLNVEDCVGTPVGSSASFALFPSPGQGMITVTAATASGFKIFNAAGQNVFDGTVTPGVQLIDLYHLPEGVYLFVAGDVAQKFVIAGR